MKINKNKGELPRHIAFIMDGNGRWAKKRGLARTVGHKFGYEKVKTVVQRCSQLGIEVCSFYAFSTENWNRPKEEIDEIFRIIRENMNADTSQFNEWNVRVTTMGDTTQFPQDLQNKLVEVIANTKKNTGMVLNLCINYGGRSDIIHAIKRIKDVSKITEQDFGRLLYGADLPPPDLIVRTSGEQRVSNFMLWQMAYSEFLFIKTYWPGITPRLIDRCIVKYQKRNRRFGKI